MINSVMAAAILFCCFILGAWVMAEAKQCEIGRTAQDVIAACEASLPRDQHCKLYAMPEGEE